MSNPRCCITLRTVTTVLVLYHIMNFSHPINWSNHNMRLCMYRVSGLLKKIVISKYRLVAAIAGRKARATPPSYLLLISVCRSVRATPAGLFLVNVEMMCLLLWETAIGARRRRVPQVSLFSRSSFGFTMVKNHKRQQHIQNTLDFVACVCVVGVSSLEYLRGISRITRYRVSVPSRGAFTDRKSLMTTDRLVRVGRNRNIGSVAFSRVTPIR